MSFARVGLALGVFAALGAAGCSTIVFQRTPTSAVSTDPIYSSTRRAYFFGLSSSENDIYIDKICLGKDVDQIVTEHTAHDVLMGIVTLGIYTPRTVEVWCSL